MLTIQAVTKHPELLAASLPLGDGTSLQLRPLRHDDVDSLERFLDSLSPLTRERWMSGGYEPEYAAELCDAIGRFDKLRMVMLTSTQPAQMVGIFEFSFGIPESDFERFKSYGIELEEGCHARFGPCLRDDYQGKGIASLVMPHMKECARTFGARHIILWGGVIQSNRPAIAFYSKEGFREWGVFHTPDGKESLDMILDL